MTSPTPSPSRDPSRDPGLQPERTRLAWRRTTLACAVAAVLAGRAALHRGLSPGALVAVALCALAWLGFLSWPVVTTGPRLLRVFSILVILLFAVSRIANG